MLNKNRNNFKKFGVILKIDWYLKEETCPDVFPKNSASS